MSKYDFDSFPDRKKTGALKWQKYEDDRGILPLWVADMDFRSAPEIIDEIRSRVDHGVFGYTIPYDEAQDEVLAYLKRRHGIDAKKEWLVWLPGLVQGLNLVCRASGDPGDAVMVNSPVYPPFLSAPVFSDMERQAVPLHWDGSRYTFDFAAMEAAVTERTKLFILCNPHNPVGRVFSREELEKLVEFCETHDLWLCSDEIHCDLILDDEVDHVSTLSLGERAAERTIAFFSASKTYNLPGLACAYAVIPNTKLRAAFKKVCRGIITEVNCLGYVGTIAAYRHGEPWRKELVRYLRDNRDHLYSTIQTLHPQIGMRHMESTYLSWMDFRELALDAPHAHFESYGVGLSNGVDFGAETGFLRLNFGCPRSMLQEGIERISRGITCHAP